VAVAGAIAVFADGCAQAVVAAFDAQHECSALAVLFFE
jgi:predicted naringenin-chalcone synthase